MLKSVLSLLTRSIPDNPPTVARGPSLSGRVSLLHYQIPTPGKLDMTASAMTEFFNLTDAIAEIRGLRASETSRGSLRPFESRRARKLPVAHCSVASHLRNLDSKSSSCKCSPRGDTIDSYSQRYRTLLLRMSWFPCSDYRSISSSEFRLSQY